ncbi:MAG: phosphate acetyltransferase [Spirochaetales bacterium]|nr:phosphate acetyltransferase [Spirochaetales bacterium]
MVKKSVVIISPENIEIFEVVKYFISEVNFVLVGNLKVIDKFINDTDLDKSSIEIVDIDDHEKAAKYGAQLIMNKKANVIMKGLIHTGLFMRILLKKEYNLFKEGQSLVSLVSKFDIPSYHKPLFLTDCGINIKPNIEQKAEIVRNAIGVVKALGLENPKIACITPVEIVNSRIQSTVDAKILKDTFGNTIIEGPISFDLALSKEAARIKDFISPVAGDADVLIFPDLDTGNSVYKSLVLFGGATVCGIVSGLKVPVVLTSRADSIKTKIDSLKLALSI